MGAQFFDVLRAVLFVSLGCASSPRGLRWLALRVSGRGARRARSTRSVGARRSPGVGLHRKSGKQGRKGRAEMEGAEDIVGCRVGKCNVGAEIVGHMTLRVAVAWATCAAPVSDAELRVLAEDEGTLGHFEN
eukprot:5195986-Pyramimonas_sp.AAC.1